MYECHGQFLPSPGGNAPLGVYGTGKAASGSSSPAQHFPLTTENGAVDISVNPETGGTEE